MKLTAKVLVPILAVSLSQVARALPFSTVVSGNWSNPFSWDPAGLSGVPNTYTTDIVTINALNVIDYNDIGGGVGSMSTPAGLFPAPGGFAIGNGNSVLIDGGTLTQSTLQQEMRIGEGTGGVGGTAFLTIQTGGTLNTGTAIGLGVGTTYDGVNFGDGELDIFGGALILGTGAATAGFGVGLDLGMGVLKVGNGLGGAASSTVDLALNDVTFAVGASSIGAATGGGTGVVTIDLDGLVTFKTKDVNIGQGGGTGTLSVVAGGGITGTSGRFLVGQGVGSTGTLINAGAIGTVVTSTGEIRIGGGGGHGNLNMTGGTLKTTGEFNVGRDGGSIGIALISGGTLQVGTTFIGRGGGTGTVTMTGGTMAISGGQSAIGDNGGSVGTLNIAGFGTIVNDVSGQDLQVGRGGGTGNLNITGGGQLTHNWWINVARDGNSTGHLTIDGNDGLGNASTLSQSAGRINVGENGTGTMEIKNGGKYIYTSAGDEDSSVGRTAGSHGTLNINTGGSFNALSNPAQNDPGARHGLRLYVGLESDTSSGVINMVGGTMSLLSFTPGNQGAGTINQTGGTINVGQWTEIGQDRNADVLPDIPNNIPGNLATYNMLGGTLNTQQLIVGSRRNGAMNMTGGTVNVGNDGTVSNNGWGDFSVGQFGTPDGGSHGNGVLTQTGGTINSNRDLHVGNQAGTFGQYDISSAGILHISNGWTRVGDSGTGTMNVSNGGTVVLDSWLNVGNEGGSVGTLNVSGATTSINLTGAANPGNPEDQARLFVGRGGLGTVNQTGGLITIGGWSAIGLDAGHGIYNLSGGQIKTVRNHDFYVGRAGGSIGELNISGTGDWAMMVNPADANPDNRGGARMTVGADGNSHGTITLTGGSLSVWSMSLGNNGEGTVNQSAGTVNVGQWLEIGTSNTAETGTNAANYNLSGTGVVNTQQLIIGTARRGTLTMTGGTINLGTDGTTPNFGWGGFEIGRNGDQLADGRLIQSGGTINANGKNMIVSSNNNTTGLATLTGGTITGVNQLNVAANGGAAGSHGTVNVNYALATDTFAPNELYIGNGANSVGVVNVTRGTLDIGGWSEIGRNGGQGTLNVIGSNARFNGSGSDMQIGYGGGGSVGNVNVTNGGTFVHNWWINLGRSGGGNGTVKVDGTGSTLTQTDGRLNIGGDPNNADVGFGLVEVSNGGAYLKQGGHELNFGTNPTSIGTMTVKTGGTFTNLGGDTRIGRNGGTGILNIMDAGSVYEANGKTFIAADAAATGTVNVTSGGTIFVNNLTISNAGGSANFGGGVFKAKSDTYNPFENFTTANSELAAGGVVFNTNNHAVSWSNTFDGVGAITKTGNGNLLVPAQATAHTGGHIVNQGSLTINEVSSLGSGDVVINGGRVVLAPMGVTEGHILGNSFDTVTANPGGAFRISQDRANSTDTGAFVDNSTWVYTGKFFVPGNVPVTWTFGEQFDDGVYLTVDANVGIINDNTWNNATKATLTLAPGEHTFEVRLGQGGGGVGPNNGWAVGFGYDPTGSDTLNPNLFQPFDDITGVFQYHDFAGTTTLTNNVVLNAAASEVNVPVSGMVSLISGTISGGGGLTKTGNGKLKLTAANSYSGGTVIDGGTLNINANAALGNVAGGVTIRNNAILQAAANVTSNRAITLGAGGGQIDVNGQVVTLDTGSSITGTSLTEADTIGGGVLNIKGTQTYSALTTTGGVTNIYTALGTGTSMITANATTNIYADQNLASLSVGAGVEVTFGDGFPFAPEPPKAAASFGAGAPGLVPEPGALGLLIVGALGFVARRRRGTQSR